MSGTTLVGSNDLVREIVRNRADSTFQGRYPMSVFGNRWWSMLMQLEAYKRLNPTDGSPPPKMLSGNLVSFANCLSNVILDAESAVKSLRECVTYGTWRTYRDHEDVTPIVIEFHPTPIGL